MVIDGDSRPRGCKFESQYPKLYGILLTFFVVNLYRCLKRPKISEKEVGDRQFKNCHL